VAAGRSGGRGRGAAAGRRSEREGERVRGRGEASPAPPRWPERRARRSACVSTRPPRETLMRKAPFFIWRILSSSMRWYVESLRGQKMHTAMHCGRISSSSMYSMPISIMSCAGNLSYAKTRQPKPSFIIRQKVLPILPVPITPMVFEPIS